MFKVIHFQKQASFNQIVKNHYFVCSMVFFSNRFIVEKIQYKNKQWISTRDFQDSDATVSKNSLQFQIAFLWQQMIHICILNWSNMHPNILIYKVIIILLRHSALLLGLLRSSESVALGYNLADTKFSRFWFTSRCRGKHKPQNDTWYNHTSLQDVQWDIDNHE